MSSVVPAPAAFPSFCAATTYVASSISPTTCARYDSCRLARDTGRCVLVPPSYGACSLFRALLDIESLPSRHRFVTPFSQPPSFLFLPSLPLHRHHTDTQDRQTISHGQLSPAHAALSRLQSGGPGRRRRARPEAAVRAGSRGDHFLRPVRFVQCQQHGLQQYHALIM